ncbi:MAG: isochorismatase family protein [Xanthobacteraceae bacterium]|jgi:nicotinamidase-related amidase
MKFRIGFAVITAAVAAAVVGPVSPGRAATIIDEWASVKRPPAPALKPVTVDAKTTALLMLDFMNQNCGKRPRCVASIPAMKKLLADARAAKVMVVYSLIANTTTADVIKDVAPSEGEPWVRSGPNKFLRTDLEKILKDKGITTVIVVGTAANGAALNTASYAALLGMNVIAPVDGISSEPFAEQYTVWHLANGPGVSGKTTLTKSDMIKF